MHPNYPLIVAANRDEFYARPTEKVHWWANDPDILAGKDLVAGGTWMGISRKGKFAAITNVREPGRKQSPTESRGLLTHNYLVSRQTDKLFSRALHHSKDQYAGYNLLYGNVERLHYYSNRHQKAEQIKPGIYGLSNAKLNTPWPKVTVGIKLLQQQLEKQELTTDRLLEILSSKKIFPDEQLPHTGVSLEWERLLSAICITGADYGTRSSSALLIDRQGRVYFHEKTHAPEQQVEVKIEFQIAK